jgi:multiple sugar transport system substrate-binding protein
MRSIRTRGRRAALASAAASLLALSLAACGGSSSNASGSSSSGGVTTLTWQMWSGSSIETDALNHLSQMVTAAHPDIKLKLQTSTFPDYWTKLAAQASGGNVGCILGVQGPRAPSIAQLLLPLDDAKLKKAGVDVADFNSSIIQALQSGGKQVAIPYDYGPLVMYYNADAFAKAGLPAPSMSWTIADFEAAATKLKSSGMSGYSFFPTVDQFAAWSLTRTGKQPLTADGKAQLDSPEMVDTFQYLQGLVKSGVAPQLPATNDTSTALNSFMSGNSAMVVDGPWQYGNILQNAKFKAGMAPMPAGPNGSRSHIAGSGYGISKTCPEPDKALEAIATITGPDAEQYLGKVGRAYPARNAQSDAWYQGPLAAAKPALSAAIQNSESFHSSANLTQIQQLFQQYGIPALNGQQSAADFLKLVQQQAGSGS